MPYKDPDRHKLQAKRWYAANKKQALASRRSYALLHRDAVNKWRRLARSRRWAEKYGETLIAQKGGCAICEGVNKSGRRLAVDHNHETGEFRGLLCSNCNTGLGKFKDDRRLLRRAIGYLRRAC